MAVASLWLNVIVIENYDVWDHQADILSHYGSHLSPLDGSMSTANKHPKRRILLQRHIHAQLQLGWLYAHLIMNVF